MTAAARSVLVALVLGLALPAALAGCGSSGPTKQTRLPTPSPSVAVISSVVTHDWGWPNSTQRPATVKHTYPVPPLPVLRTIAVGRHEADKPAFDRISFTFTGTFPSYDLLWVRELVADPKGEPIPLEGDGILRIRFTQADAHDESGSTVTSSPPAHVGYPAIASFVQAGDFEGVLTFGVGNVRTVHDSNPQVAVRITEVKTTDGHGGYRFVVAIDIQTRGLGGVTPTAD